jgi:multiple sugar transport system substrate-binding protein
VGGLLALACAGAAPGAIPAQRETVTVTFWGPALQDSPTNQAWWHAAVVEVERRWPYIHVDDTAPSGNVQTLVAAVAAGSPPDVSVWDSSPMADLARQGALAPLDGYVRSHKVDLSDCLTYHVQAGTWKGTQYGLAAHGGFSLPAFNQALGAAAGLPDPAQEDARGAWTWDSYAQFAARLMAAQGGTAAGGIYGTGRGPWQQWVINNGGNLLSADATTFALDQPAALAGLQFWVDLVTKYRVAPGDDELKADAEPVRWRTGRLGFWFAVRGSLANTGADIGQGFTWSLAPVPQGRSKKIYLTSNGQTFLFKTAKHPDDAFLVLWGWSGRDGQLARLKGGDGFTPSLKSVVSAPEFLQQKVYVVGKPDFPVPENFNRLWAEEIQKNNLEGIPNHPMLPKILSEVTAALTPAVAGTKGVAEVVAGLKPTVSALLQQ